MNASAPDRYLFVMPWVPDSVGGVNQVVRNLYDRMEADGGFDPFIFVNDWAHPAPIERTDDGRRLLLMRIRAPDAGSPRLKRLALYFVTLPAALIRLRSLLRRYRVSVVNVHYPSLYALNFALLKTFGMYPGRLIVSVHGIDLETAAHAAGIERRLWAYLFRASDRVVACSEALRARVAELFPACADRSSVVHNGVDPSIPDRVVATDFAVPGLGEADEPVVNLATFEPKKGQDTLIRAFAAIADRRPHARLVLVGRAIHPDERRTRDELESLAGECGVGARVVFCENLEHPDAMHVLSRARVFCLPSRVEPFGIAILEAGLFGVPVVASRVGGIPEIVEHDVDAKLVPVDDAEALAAELGALLDDEQLRSRLGGALRDKVRERFSWERALGEYQRFGRG